eukprot:ANDGO_01922.mRNA.1 hypothetical protein CAOG_05310
MIGTATGGGAGHPCRGNGSPDPRPTGMLARVLCAVGLAALAIACLFASGGFPQRRGESPGTVSSTGTAGSLQLTWMTSGASGVRQQSVVREQRRAKPSTADHRVPVVNAAVSTISRTLASANYFEVFDSKSGSYAKIYLHGANIGLSTPGHDPGAISLTYDDCLRYFGYIRDLHMNAIRVYILVNTDFYRALRDHNTILHPEHPIYLVQGIWSPEDEKFAASAKNGGNGADVWDSAITAKFEFEVDNTVRAVHGNFSTRPYPGQPGGDFTADVSPWTIAWIIGSEWDPSSVIYTNQVHTPNSVRQELRFLAVPDTPSVTAFDWWLARIAERTAALDNTYGTQRALGFMNWVSTDWISHPDDAAEDRVTVDPTHILATDLWTGGVFATVNAYPYYPDAIKWEGYEAYLKRLKAALNGKMALMISEDGLPTSLGMAHEGPDGRNHGHVHEGVQGVEIVKMMGAVRDNGYVGFFVFSLVDEWFKRTWNVMSLEIPAENRRKWLNVLSAEQLFGIVAAEPANAVYVDGICDSQWQNRTSLSVSNDENVRITSDEGYIYISIRNAGALGSRFSIGLEVNPNNGAQVGTLHGRHEDPSALQQSLRFSKPVDIIIDYSSTSNSLILYAHSSLDFFSRAHSEEYGWPMYLGPQDFTVYTIAATIPRMEGSKGILHPAKADHAGEMTRGTTNPNDNSFSNLALWNIQGAGCFEARIPWAMAGVADPSSKQGYFIQGVGRGGSVPLSYSLANGIGVEVVSATNPTSTSLQYNWEAWDAPNFIERKKKSFSIISDYIAKDLGIGAADGGDEGGGQQAPNPSPSASNSATMILSLASVIVSSLLVLLM